MVPHMKWKNTSKQQKKKDSTDVSCAHNLFSEQQYILEGSEDTNMAQVHNLVGTSRIQSSLGTIDLLSVSNLLPNSLFEKQKFAAITIRLGEPTCTVLLFTSGKMVLTGCKSLLDCILASKIVTNLMRQGFPGNVFTLEPIKIQNIVGNALVPLLAGEVLDLNRFYRDFNIFCTYQPNMFPGLIYRPTNLPIVLLIFFSGKVVITGAKNIPDVYFGWNEMRKLLRNYTMGCT
jgi:transcription initiation factor TFIID TATA-box-binding protein